MAEKTMGQIGQEAKFIARSLETVGDGVIQAGEDSSWTVAYAERVIELLGYVESRVNELKGKVFETKRSLAEGEVER